MNVAEGGKSELGTIEESAGTLSEAHRDLSRSTSLLPTSEERQNSGSDEDSDEEEFVYPGASVSSINDADEPEPNTGEGEQSVIEEVQDATSFVYQPPVQTICHPSPAQLEALYAAASSGDLPLLQKLVQTALQGGDLEAFALANDASSRTGFTALHAAASRGHLNVVKWLIEDCGAMPDLEDREGETALHKAALHGHFQIVTYLLPDRADVHARDADGWTPLHNACSQGYLDIVRWLCENGNAVNTVDGICGVDLQSKGGWTPLMNAASKGHLPIVLYLLAKQAANPLVRNKWGETAYDVAAAVFEVWICEILQKAEADRWHGSTVSYNPLAVHTAVPLVLFENQRLDSRLKTLAISGGKPRFSASGLGKQGRRAPFELKLPEGVEVHSSTLIPAWRSDVQLPLTEDPWTLPIISPKDKPRVEGADRSHFWLCDWTLDVTHPGVDAEDGWQYARLFSSPDESWTAEPPSQLYRLLNSNGVMAAGLGGSTRDSTSAGLSSSSSISSSSTWVRRRRWVRVMRRRLDIPPLPFLQPDGLMYHLSIDGAFIPAINNESDMADGEGQELDTMPSTFTSTTGDYVTHARYLVGNQVQDSESQVGAFSAAEARQAIIKLERATSELRQGIPGDANPEHKKQAQVLLNAYSRELDRRKLAASAQGLVIGLYDDSDIIEEESDEEFHYPGSSPPGTVRTPSMRSNSTDYRIPITYPATDLTSHLSRSTEFRVPTREAPQKTIGSNRVSSISQHTRTLWERDDAVYECRGCRRRFGFLLRRHCRKCGRIFCDRCSSHKALLEPSDVVHDPASPESGSSLSSYRVCSSCHDEISLAFPSRLSGSASSNLECIVVEQGRLRGPDSVLRGGEDSQSSDFAECPVCSTNLVDLEPASEQVAHLRHCMQGSSGTSSLGDKYLVYRLPPGSALLGTECVICLDGFVTGSVVARLSCMCSFHSVCLSFWLQRKRSCPVHAR